MNVRSAALRISELADSVEQEEKALGKFRYDHPKLPDRIGKTVATAENDLTAVRVMLEQAAGLLALEELREEGKIG